MSGLTSSFTALLNAPMDNQLRMGVWDLDTASPKILQPQVIWASKNPNSQGTPKEEVVTITCSWPFRLFAINDSLDPKSIAWTFGTKHNAILHEQLATSPGPISMYTATVKIGSHSATSSIVMAFNASLDWLHKNCPPWTGTITCDMAFSASSASRPAASAKGGFLSKMRKTGKAKGRVARKMASAAGKFKRTLNTAAGRAVKALQAYRQLKDVKPMLSARLLSTKPSAAS